MNEAILRAESIGRTFGERTVLKAATLYAFPGRITALVGRNGCGKSTLLKISAGVLAAHYGTVHFGGGMWTRPRLAQLARSGLFFIPEQGLLSRLWTLDQHLRIASTDASLRDAAAAALDLTHVRHQFRGQLSGGERRRADFALVRLRAPRCLLADEPFLGIAPLDVARISRELRVLRDTGTSIVITGHEISALLDVADDIVWLTAGTTHAFRSVQTALESDQFRREYLGT